MAFEQFKPIDIALGGAIRPRKRGGGSDGGIILVQVTSKTLQTSIVGSARLLQAAIEVLCASFAQEEVFIELGKNNAKENAFCAHAWNGKENSSPSKIFVTLI